MKIRDEIKRIIGKNPMMISRFNMETEENFPDSPIQNVIEIPTQPIKLVKCHFCERDNHNWCWNCEKPHCKKHGHAVWFPDVRIINTFCEDCFNDALEEMNKLKNQEKP